MHRAPTSKGRSRADDGFESYGNMDADARSDFDDRLLGVQANIGVICALLTGLISSLDHFSYFTNPPLTGLVMRAMHSFSFWSLITAVFASIKSAFVSLYDRRVVAVTETVVYFLMGILAYIVYMNLLVIATAYRMTVLTENVVDQQSGMSLPTAMAYIVPQVLILTSFVVRTGWQFLRMAAPPKNVAA